MNDIPFTLADPRLNVCQSLGGGTAIGGNPMEVDFVLEEFACGKRVADGDGITNQEYSWQLGLVFNWGKGAFFGLGVQRGSYE